MADPLTMFLDVASKVQKLGETYYKESRNWEAFPQKVKQLRRESKIWVEALRNYGILDEDILDTLSDATSLLQNQEGILEDRLQPTGFVYASVNGCCSRWWFLFPNECQDNMRDVEEAFESIARLLKRKEEAKCAAEREMSSRPLSMVFCKDARYVPLETTEREIDSALRSSIDFLALLHGGPGQGKSTLAQHMALHYESIKLFENVIFLECGPKVNTSVKQLDLLKNLAITVTGDKKELTEDKPTSDPQMLHLLKNALRTRKVLIIFDDVWEAGFLHDMINLCGDNVKLLVTSQLGALCNQLKRSFRAIEIQKCSDEVAKRILFSHVRFPKDHIPNQQILEVVGEIIKDTGGNPLALASVASAIPQGRKNSPSEWEEASLTLTQLLGQEIHGSYPRSFWSAMQLAIERLSEAAQNLYVLVHLCKGPSVPEEVIRYFFYQITLPRPQVTFQTLANELEERQLLNITIASVDSHLEERSWSTHSLQKKFMEDDEDMKRKKEILSEGIKTSPKCSQGEDALVRDALCVLYCEDQFTKKVGAQLKVSDERFNDLQRKAFEPITRLLGRNATHHAASRAQTVTKLVFVQYFYKEELRGEFDDDNLSVLLNMRDYPWAQYATLAAIGDIFLSLEMDLKQDSKLLSTLQTFLLDNQNPILQQKAAKCLSKLASISTSNEIRILEKEWVLVRLVSAMCDEKNPGLQIAAATALSNLSYSEESALKVCRTEGAFPGLVNALSKDDNQELQQAAGATMMNLADGPDSCKLQIVEAEGAIPKLMEFLNDGNAELRGVVLLVLWSLIRGGDKMKFSILKHEEVFAALVRLSKDDNLDMQQEAADTIQDLFNDSKSFEPQVVGEVVVLVKSLCDDENAAAQLNAAATLSSLADTGNAIRFCILKQEGALAALVKFLSIYENPTLQYYAARAMANLAKGEDSCKLPIVKGDGAVAALLKSLANDQNPKLQKEAARALQHLACGRNTMNLSIIEHEGALEALLRCLSNADPQLQNHAIWTLSNLGDVLVSFEPQIVGEVAVLVKSLCNDENAAAQLDAVDTLSSLARAGDTIRLCILKQEGALEALVKFLSIDENPTRQYGAASIMSSLADGGDSCKLPIVKGDGAVAALLKSLSNDQNPRSQLNAGHALAHLARGGDAIKVSIMEHEGALALLVRCLLKGTNILLQSAAALTIAKLSEGSLSIKLAIVGEEGAVGGLVKSSLNEGYILLRGFASKALKNLADGGEEIKTRMLEENPEFADVLKYK